MRKNTRQVIDAFLSGKALKKCHSIHTDGKVIYSYAEPIAALDPYVPGGYVVTSETYSRTTSNHTHSIRFELGLTKQHVSQVSESELAKIVRLLDNCD